MKALFKPLGGINNLVLKEVLEREPVGDEVKIKVAYVGICGTDLHIMKGEYGKGGVVLGHEFSGVITAVGEDVNSLKVGQRVTSETTYKTCGVCPNCIEKDYNLCSNRVGIGTLADGAMAEYVISREESVHILPANTSLLAGALSEPLSCGVHAVLEKSSVKKGDIVCVFGSGAIGLSVAQVAKQTGAFVILAGLSADKERFEIAKELGVNKILDQQSEDIEAYVADVTNGVGVDVAFECSGAIAAVNKAFSIVRRKGQVIQMGVFPESKQMIETDMILHKEIEYIGSRSQKPSSWEIAMELLEKGLVDNDCLVTKKVLLDDWKTGFDYVAAGKGTKTVIEINGDL